MLSWFRGFVITEPLVWSASWWSWGATGPTWALMAWCCLCCSQPRLPSAFLYHCRLTWTFYPPSNMLILSGRRVTSLWCSGPCHVSGGPTLYFASLSASASPLRWRIPLRIRNMCCCSSSTREAWGRRIKRWRPAWFTRQGLFLVTEVEIELDL